MKCPAAPHHDSRAKSTREFLDDMNTEDDEQKFCCGDMTNRFCCSFAEKLREIPGFDPSEHYDASVRYRLAHSGYHFWHYFLGFTLSVLAIGFISYVFGSIIFEVHTYLYFFSFWYFRK